MLEILATVRVLNEDREPYVARLGLVVKIDSRDGKPYYGLDFEGVHHVVWFFEDELSAELKAGKDV